MEITGTHIKTPESQSLGKEPRNLHSLQDPPGIQDSLYCLLAGSLPEPRIARTPLVPLQPFPYILHPLLSLNFSLYTYST